MSSSFQHVLIVEPKASLDVPYLFIASFQPQQHITRLQKTDQAIQEIRHHLPDLVCLSASFSPSKSLHFLEALKNASETRLVPLIFVVDWSERVPRLLGTSWGGKVGILHSLSSPAEVNSTLTRLASMKS